MEAKKAKGNTSPPSRVVNVPAEFLPLIVEERDRHGCFTTCEIMGKILQQYFGKRPAPQTLKGVKKNGD